jgi:signal transduction histidine kinase
MLNLLSNAADALNGKGRIDVAAQVRGGRTEITVADNGPGVADVDRQRIFEPFYTQKADGTGLGLALVKRFVEECDGQIRCESNHLGGTTFRITLPETTHSSQPSVAK